MLTLTRKINDEVVIIDEHGLVIVKINIREIRRNQVRISFEADRALTISRAELDWSALHQDRQEQRHEP